MDTGLWCELYISKKHMKNVKMLIKFVGGKCGRDNKISFSLFLCCSFWVTAEQLRCVFCCYMYYSFSGSETDCTEDHMYSSRVKMGIWFGGNKKELGIAQINLHYRNNPVLFIKITQA